jgi:hypothetical protein
MTTFWKWVAGIAGWLAFLAAAVNCILHAPHPGG